MPRDILATLAADLAFAAASVLCLLTWTALCIAGWWSLLALLFGGGRRSPVGRGDAFSPCPTGRRAMRRMKADFLPA